MRNHQFLTGLLGYLFTLCCFGSSFASKPVPKAVATPKWVMGYYPLYERGLYPMGKIDFASLTHLTVGRVWPNADGSLNISFDLDTVAGPKAAKLLSQKTHAAGKKAILMVGGADTNLNAEWSNATNATHRARLVNNLVKVATQLGFDGFDLDWEENINYEQFFSLTQQLHKAAPTKLVTIPVNWHSANDQQIDPFFKKVAPLVNQINIMTYGMADNWQDWRSWHSSALHGSALNYPSSVDDAVRAYVNAGVPTTKLGVGIGFYGSCWQTPITAPRQSLAAFHGQVINNGMSYADIMNKYYLPTNYRYDVKAQAPYLSSLTPMGPNQCTFVSYENARSITAKANYIKQKKLGGVIIWTINQGYNPKSASPNALLQAVNKALR